MKSKKSIEFLALMEACRVLEFVLRVKYNGTKTKEQICDAIIKRIPEANEAFKGII